MSYTFGWRHKSHGNAQAIGEEIESLRIKMGGNLPTQSVVNHARNKKSALHGSFEWNDEIAAESFRRSQARSIIRDLVIKVEGDNGPVETGYVNVVVTVDDSQEQFYMTEHDALAKPSTRAYVLERARNEAERYRDKYRHLTELAGVIHEMEKFIEAA